MIHWHCIFTHGSRLFKVIGITGGYQMDLSWQIVEVHKVKHDKQVCVEVIGTPFIREMKLMNEMLNEKKIEII